MKKNKRITRIVERFEKNSPKEQTFSCLVRLNRHLIGRRLFSVRLGLFGQWNNSYSFLLGKKEDGSLDLRYLVRDNGFTVKGSMQNAYESFIKEGDIVKLEISLYRENDKNKEQEMVAHLSVRHPQRDDSRRVDFMEGYSSTSFQYHMKANPSRVVAKMTKHRLAHVADADSINYTKKQ